MTARELAERLKMLVSTIYELARRGELPCRRIQPVAVRADELLRCDVSPG
jgi:hypothetical protein